MSAHTPGPWRWEERNGYDVLVSCVEGEFYSNGDKQHVEVIDDGSAGGEYSASIDVDGPDARLIAAAPDLLEALKDLREAINSRGVIDTVKALKKTDAAIAKATATTGSTS